MSSLEDKIKKAAIGQPYVGNFYASHGLKYPVVSRPSTVDIVVKEKLFTEADIIAMLTELQQEIEETVKEEELIDKKWANGLHYSEKIIQEKIDKITHKPR